MCWWTTCPSCTSTMDVILNYVDAVSLVSVAAAAAAVVWIVFDTSSSSRRRENWVNNSIAFSSPQCNMSSKLSHNAPNLRACVEPSHSITCPPPRYTLNPTSEFSTPSNQWRPSLITNCKRGFLNVYLYHATFPRRRRFRST